MEEKVLLTKDKELIKQIGDDKKFLKYLEGEVISMYNKGYATHAIAKKLSITEEATKFFIDRHEKRIKLIDQTFKGLF